ncbi:MAG TPA: TPM domain-containing protein [Candidatus Acidoferrum sp.]|nr:TPM domain-containing protein [Candidatus Acidoferrum sp.]
MQKTHLARTAVLYSLLLFSVSFCAAEDIKQIHPTGYVSDLAGVIGPEARTRLEALCAEVERKTGAQMAIVTVQSLEGESVENYAVNLFKQLGVGSKKDNRSVLLFVAPNERKYHIEVGYGLEPVINDARAGDAGRAMVPYLRQGDYGKAAEAGAWQLARYIAADAGATLSGQPLAARNQNEGGNFGFPVFWVILGLIVLFRVIGSLSGGRRGGSGGSGLLWFLLGMFANSSGGRSGSSWGGGGFGGGGGGGFGGFGGGSSGGGGASGSW